MITRYLLPFLGVLGLVVGIIFSLTYGSPEAATPNQLSLPPSAPFNDTISGTGLVEASSRNIEVGSFASGIVAQVLVKEGDRVEAGTPLFVLDEREAKAALSQRESDVVAAKANVAASRAAYDDVADQLKRAEKLTIGSSISLEAVQSRRFAVKRAAAAIQVAQGQQEAAEAALESARVLLENLSVEAPIAGRVLKVRVRPGEFVTAMSGGQGAVFMGEDQPLHLRVDIDENDVWRLKENVKATASLRSNKDISYPLSFVRIEPYVQPKKNLNGDMTERVDTRIMEVVYKIETGNDLPSLYIGQQMDVFISAK